MAELIAAIPWPEVAWSPIPFALGIAADRLYIHLTATSRNRRSQQ